VNLCQEHLFMSNVPPRTRSYPARNCPVCGEISHRRLFRQDFAGLSSGGLLSGYDVVVCAHCGCAFADDIPPQETFDAYYRDMSKYEYHHRDGLEPQWVLERYRSLVRDLRPLLASPEARILDIGCANGGLLSCFKEAGFANVLGVDPSARCAEAAQRLHGVRVLTHPLSELDAISDRFDMILLTGVLEHVRELGPPLRSIRRILADGGSLCIEVPDATAFAEHPNAPFQEFSLEHVNFFSPASLANLMRPLGLSMTYHNCRPEQLSRDANEPDVLAVFKPTAESGPLVPDTDCEAALLRYIRQCQGTEQRVRNIISDLATTARPILVWGAGTNTLRLLATSDLGTANIVAFIDSNANFAGKKLLDKPILLPAQLAGHNEPILICSWVYQREIELQIRQQLRAPNPVIRLYHAAAGDESPALAA